MLTLLLCILLISITCQNHPRFNAFSILTVSICWLMSIRLMALTLFPRETFQSFLLKILWIYFLILPKQTVKNSWPITYYIILCLTTVFKAYCDHYPLELSVEDFWVAIAQGVSIHLNQNAEKFRHLLVEHEGKKELMLIVDHLRIPKSDRPANGNQSVPAINWPLAVREMCDLIKKDMKADLTTLMTKRFSSTTDVEGAVFDCTLMDTVKSYYSYGFGLTCGIPQVTLRGTPGDFQELIDRVQQLKIFFTDFHWWFDALLPHINKLKESAEGNADIDWWQKICHRNNNMSGVDLLMGWLADFIPNENFTPSCEAA
ncbi:unnamed protein product [Rotaria sp. Silwood1]|nr:unnamed protein product [Rotaria sp. Silwood1]CAF1590861.1 unnamed protein product [Rotaria sp. Silwood1]CAF3727868.1 unnamed protein product [Rotaria sp. Silwood1]CAF3735852.1 unnamed protein product [Rotaria sp. Silwood1]CAF4587840.1 unnamed protein product [Rotaria sp. Silwood1]